MALSTRTVGPVLGALAVVGAIAFLSASPTTTEPPSPPTPTATFTIVPSADDSALTPALEERRLVVTDGSAAWLVGLDGAVHRTVPSVPSLGGIDHLALQPGSDDRIVHSRGPCELGGIGLQLQRTLEVLGCVRNAVFSPEGDRLAVLVDSGEEHVVLVVTWRGGREQPDGAVQVQALAIAYDQPRLERWEWRAGSPDGSRAGRLLLRADTALAWELFAVDLREEADGSLAVPDPAALVPARPHRDGSVPIAAEAGFVLDVEMSFPDGDGGHGVVTTARLSARDLVTVLPLAAPDAGRLWLSAADGLAVVGDGLGHAWYLSTHSPSAPFDQVPGRIIDAVVVPAAVG